MLVWVLAVSTLLLGWTLTLRLLPSDGFRGATPLAIIAAQKIIRV